MKLSVVFLFISVLSVCFVAGQSERTTKVPQNSALSTSHQDISNGPVAEYICDSNCTIGWSTSAAGPMALHYGTDRTKMTQQAEAVDSKDGRNHHVRLDGLKPNTRYYFSVVASGEPVGGVGTFQTVDQGEPPIRSKAVIPE